MYLSLLKEASKASVKIKLLTPQEEKKFISKFKDASSSYSNHDIYGVIDNGIFVGGIVIAENPNQKIYQKYKLKCEAEIVFIYLLNKYRKIGLGQRLLNIPMKKYKTLGLITNKGFTTEGAYQLYRKNNFREIEKRSRTSNWYWRK
jgi:ribosomal protein S18 acetylase RimI-like enzyme